MCPFGQFYPMSSFEKIAFKFVFDKSHVDRGKLHHLKHKKKFVIGPCLPLWIRKVGKLEILIFYFLGPQHS